MPFVHSRRTFFAAAIACMVLSPMIRVVTATGRHTVKAVVSNKRGWHWIRPSIQSANATRRPSTSLPARESVHRTHRTNSTLRHQSNVCNDDSNQLRHKYRVHVAVGSNLGDRFANIRQALELLCRDRTVASLVRTSFLHESAPMYVTDQPAFLNGVVELSTNLEPLELLHSIKRIEAQLGRDVTSQTAPRNGPRPVDLDILSYETLDRTDDTIQASMLILDTPELTIPHLRISERDFVLMPLVEVAGPDLVLPGIDGTVGDAWHRLWRAHRADHVAPMVRVLPLPRGRLLYLNATLIMGILNVTPDSFSDGGQWNDSVEAAVQRALAMVQEGVDIIDVGGESTRPGAKEVSIEEELRRTIPIVRGIRQKSNISISIDTRHALVAEAAIEAGADIVNDVSGGCFDPAMLPTVGRLGVPMVLMHMRGTPETMQRLTEYETDVVHEVGLTLLDHSNHAAWNGVHRWMQIVDPGIGFAKNLHGNLLLLQNMGRIRTAVQDLPLLIGTSRKGFIGTIAGVSRAEDRDAGTIASCVAALCLEKENPQVEPVPYRSVGCSILRVHNVADCKQAAMVMDAVRNA